jgi:citrate synthase
MQMMNDIRENVHDWSDRDEVKSYLGKMLDGQVFDKKGLIYGMGHAVYSLSDPRERVFRSYVEHLAEAKGRQKDMNLYNMIEEVAPELIAEKRHIFKGVSPNVDFYSGFVYEMLGIPSELYTPLFAIARMHTGWRSWWDATKLFVRHIRVLWKNWNKIITADRIAFYFALC